MKTNRFSVRCYLMVPTIFAGFTALAALITYHWIRLPRTPWSGTAWALPGAITLLVVTAFLTGWLILWLLMHPVEQFMQTTARWLPPAGTPDAKPHAPTDAVGGVQRSAAPVPCDSLPIQRMLDRVTATLSEVEAQTLFPDLVAPSESMRSVLGLVLKIAPTDSTVLILGESGTGKEMIARGIHRRSKRAEKPFVAINCAGIPESLLESELFGHEKGAFTGAYARKIGKFEAAAGGTIFLDEIADMPMVTQAKILRVLQEREMERVGGTASVRVDVRVLAATNKDLRAMVRQGTFREDLFFRIDVFTLTLPPLRQRAEDIPVLALHCLRQVNPDLEITPQAMALLMAHAWPGNVRELRNVIEAAATLADRAIEPRHLSLIPPGVDGAMAGGWDGSDPLAALNLDQRLQSMERGLILEALHRTHGVQVEAARLLGIKERSLWHRVAKHHIDVGAIRGQEVSHATV